MINRLPALLRTNVQRTVACLTENLIVLAGKFTKPSSETCRFYTAPNKRHTLMKEKLNNKVSVLLF